MLTIYGAPQRVCSGPTRREMLQACGAGLFGASLPTVLAAEDAGGVTLPVRAKRVLFLYLYGGPAQHETWDMKPDAPSGIRGPFQPIASRTPDLLISEYLPKMAAMSDKFAVVRTLHTTHNNHHACHWIKTGRPWHMPETVFNATEKDWPSMGSVVECLDQQSAARTGTPRDIPSYFYAPAPLGHLQGYDYPGQYAGWLGRAYNALATNFKRRDNKDNPFFREVTDEEMDLRIQGLEEQTGLPLDRLYRRKSLLEQFDAARTLADRAKTAATYSRLQQKAFDLASSQTVRDALDVRQEPANVRDRYGRHLYGQSVLLGRRLLEAGARFVTVQWECPDGYSWDSHIHSNDIRDKLLPGLDQTYTAVMDDLSDRGMLDETLVVLTSEMGRTPQGTATWGRQHWCHCFSMLLAGGGIQGGQVYGKSDKEAGYPADKPVRPADLSATIFAALGIDPDLQIHDPEGRPVSITDHGRVLTELFG
jgi:hypothetical protein